MRENQNYRPRLQREVGETLQTTAQDLQELEQKKVQVESELRSVDMRSIQQKLQAVKAQLAKGQRSIRDTEAVRPF